MAFISLLSRAPAQSAKQHPSKHAPIADISENDGTGKRPFQVYGIRLTELTERESSVMKVSELDEYSDRDPIVNTFLSFGQIRNFTVSGSVMIAPESAYATTLTDRASDISANMMLIPWTQSGALSENQASLGEFSQNRFATGLFTDFVAATLRNATCTTGIFIDNSFGSKRTREQRSTLTRTVSTLSARDMRNPFPSTPLPSTGHHIFLPYFGSEDDKTALRLVLQLAQDPSVTATIVHFALPEETTDDVPPPTAHSTTVPKSLIARIRSAPAPAPQAASHATYATFFAALRDSLLAPLAPRVLFESAAVGASPLPTYSQRHGRSSDRIQGMRGIWLCWDGMWGWGI